MKNKNITGWLLAAILTMAGCVPQATYTIRSIEYRDTLIGTEDHGQGQHILIKQVADTVTVTTTSEQIGNRAIGDTVRLNNSDYCCVDFVVISKSK